MAEVGKVHFGLFVYVVLSVQEIWRYDGEDAKDFGSVITGILPAEISYFDITIY